MIRNALVIGGGGLIGHHLVPMLQASGWTLSVLGRRAASRYPLPPDVRYISGDFGDTTILPRLLGEHSTVICLAYATVPKTSYDNPLEDLLQNLPRAVELFSAAASSGNRLVWVSSGGTVYGDVDSTPIREDHPTNPISPYGVTKLTIEKYARLFAVTRGLQIICLRPANAYGIGQRPFTGQGFIATAIGSVLKGIPIELFGEGETVRDYIYATDLAAGILAAAERGKAGETYNIGTGIGYSNLEIVKEIESIMAEVGCRTHIERHAPRPFDVRSNILDSTQLTRATSWKPQVSLSMGLVMTRDWMLNQAAVL
jgi:UDP-glucose 4-epimerase